MSNDDVRNKINNLYEEVKKRREEIEHIEKKLQELNEKTQNNKQINENSKKMLNDVTDMLNLTLKAMEISGKTSDSNRGEFIDIINNLAELSKKTGIVKKEFNILGKKGVFEYKIYARPLKGYVEDHSSINSINTCEEALLNLNFEVMPRSFDKNEP